MSTPSIYKSASGQAAVMALYDAALDRWPVSYEGLTISTRHGDTFVIACGPADAPPMVLLHGAGTSSAIWAGDVVEFAQHYRVYAADLPGEPNKSTQNRPPWDGPSFAEWLADVFDGLAITQATIVGISQGGWTALKFATAYPERMAALALLCPGGVVADKASFLLMAIPLSMLGMWGAKRLVHMTYGDQTVPDDVDDIIVTVMGSFKPRIGTLPLLPDEALRRLTMPVFLLGGGKDVIRDNQKVADRLRQFVPHLRVTILPGAGHTLLNTTGHVMAFLRELTPA
jgi:pimeloyl-ACP methyl ester carboxylesterase